MAYRHLQPDDDASLISLVAGDRSVTDVMVTMTDAEGQRFRVRAPVSPREVARLLQLLQEANLQVGFSAEHEFLVAIDAFDRVIGGLYYREVGDRRVRMEKIVVQREHRRKGISDGLMQELLSRLASRGMVGVLTGFFRPEYMQRFGFRVEPRFEGMVRDLDEPAARTRSQRPLSGNA
jgi:GNAT superfamily N-acetyltransferase